MSNGAAKTTDGLLAAAGMDRLVEQVVTVEDVKLSKPRAEVYLYAAQAAGVAPVEMALIATHPWDLHGAKVAGLLAGYVSWGLPYSKALRMFGVTGQTVVDVASEIARI